MQDESVEVLASSIKIIAEGVKKLRAGALNEKCILLLIEHACTPKVGKKQIKAVLDALEGLSDEYLKGET